MRYFTFLLFALIVFPAQAQYSQNCVSNIGNATLIIPEDVDRRLPSGRKLAARDTVALRTERGVCAGYGVIRDTAKTVFAVAGYDQYSEVGFKPGELLSYEVADASQGDTLDLGADPVYRPCEGFTLCKDTGEYEDGVVYTLDAMSRTAIPVELARFEARADGTKVQVSWKTASETNNAGFHLEIDQERIAFVEGHGTTSQPHTYRYTTRPLDPGKYDVRLAQVDKDGTVSYTDPVAVRVGVDERRISEVRPNPVHEKLTVVVELPKEQTVRGYAVNLLGQRVMELTSRRAEGKHSIRMDVSGLSSGQYFLVLEGKGWKTNRRFTIVK